MSLHAPVGGASDFEVAPTGMHIARCTRVIDQGTQEITFANETKLQRKVWVMWELPRVLREWKNKDGETQVGTAVVSQRYTLSTHPKARLRADIESWFGRKYSDKDLDEMGGFDVKGMLDKPAFINIVHSDDGKYANIASINPMPDGMEVPERVGELIYLELEKEGYDAEVFGNLSEKMRSTIIKSPEWQFVSGAMAEKFPVPGDEGQPELPSAAEEECPF